MKGKDRHRHQSNTDSDSSSSSSSDQEEERKRAVEKYYTARSILKKKYLEHRDVPESHSDYAFYLEKFRRKYGELLGLKKANKWRDYWKDRMDDAFETDCNRLKRSIEEELEQDSKRSQRKRQKNKQEDNRPTQNTQFKVQPGKLSRSYQPSLLTAVVKIKDEPMDKDEKIPISKVEKMLENYDLRVKVVTANIQETFDGYLSNYRAFPFIDFEKKNFLDQLKTGKSFGEEDVLQFEEKFLQYWPNRLQLLREKELEMEIKKIRAKWVELVPDPRDVTYDDSISQRRLSEEEIEFSERKGSQTDDPVSNTASVATQTEKYESDEETLKIYNGTEQPKVDETHTPPPESLASPSNNQPSPDIATLMTIKKEYDSANGVFDHRSEIRDEMSYLLSWLCRLTPREQSVLLSSEKSKNPQNFRLLKQYLRKNGTWNKEGEVIEVDQEDSDVELVLEDGEIVA